MAVLTEEGLDGKEQIFGVAVWTVILSVLLHGMSAGWLAKRYGRHDTGAPLLMRHRN